MDVWEIIDAAATKPFGFMPFYPGPGLGGHCIPVDPIYLSWKVKEVGFEARVIDLAGQVNAAMPHHVVAKISDTVDCCCGFRARRMDTASKRWGSRLANAVRNRALGEEIIDTGCSVKAFKVEYVRTLQPWDGLHRFFASFVAMQGGRITQIPVNHRTRSAGTSKYTNWRRLRKTVRDLRGVIWLKSRTRPCVVREA